MRALRIAMLLVLAAPALHACGDDDAEPRCIPIESADLPDAAADQAGVVFVGRPLGWLEGCEDDSDLNSCDDPSSTEGCFNPFVMGDGGGLVMSPCVCELESGSSAGSTAEGTAY